MPDLVLASRSPRRADLLKQIRVAFDAIAADVSEAVAGNETASQYVSRIALTKTLEVEQLAVRKALYASAIPFLGADTAVVIDNEILGKPADKDDAIRMLMKLSNKTHKVITGVVLKKGDQLETFVTETLVSFRKLNRNECEHYWHTGEPSDKSGSYAIQGLGGIFVSSITGSYSSVVGLPLMETVLALRKFGVECLAG